MAYIASQLTALPAHSPHGTVHTTHGTRDTRDIAHARSPCRGNKHRLRLSSGGSQSLGVSYVRDTLHRFRIHPTRTTCTVYTVLSHRCGRGLTPVLRWCPGVCEHASQVRPHEGYPEEDEDDDLEPHEAVVPRRVGEVEGGVVEERVCRRRRNRDGRYGGKWR